MAQKIDELYYDLELRTEKFHTDVVKAETDLSRLNKSLGTQVPLSSTVAANAMRQVSTAAKLSSVEMERQIQTLAKGTTFTTTRAASVAALVKIEGQLLAALDRENLALGTKIALEQRLASTQAALTATTTAAATAATGLAGIMTGGLSTAVTIATGLLVSYFLSARKEISDTESAIQRIIDHAKARKDAPIVITRLELDKATKEAEAAEARLTKLVAETQRSNTLSAKAGGQTTGLTDDARERAFREAVDAVNLARAKQIGLERELIAQRASGFESNERQLEQEAAQLGTVLRSGKATEAQLKRIADLRKVYGEVAAKTAGTDLASLQAQTRALGILASLEDRRAKDAPKDSERDREIENANKVLDELAAKSEKAKQAAKDAASEAQITLARMAGQSVAVLQLQIAELTAQYKDATPQQRAAILAPFEAALKAAQALNGALQRINVPKESQQALVAVAETITDSTTGARTFGDVLRDVTATALGVATALSGANSDLTTMIAGAGQLLQAFVMITDLSAATKGGLGAIFQTASGIASLVPALGAVINGVGLLSSILGGGAERAETPEEREHRESLATNNQRLAELRDVIIKQIALSVPSTKGRAIAGVPLFGEQQEIPGSYGFGPFTGALRRSVADILADFRKLGVSLEDLKRVAADLGFELSDNPTFEQLEAIVEGLRLFDLGLQEFGESLDIVNQKLRFKLIDEGGALDEAIDAFKEFLAKRLSAALDLSDLDFSSLENFRKSFAPILEKIFEDGIIDPGEEGILDAAGELIDIWERALGKVKTPADLFAQEMEAWSLAFERGSLTAAARLAKSKESFAKYFPELAEVLDFSSLENLDESISHIVDAFAADGELTAAEREQIAALEGVRAAYEATTEAVKKNKSALDSLDTKFRVGGQSAEEQLDDTLDAHRRKGRQRFDPEGGGGDVGGGFTEGDPVSKAVSDFIGQFNIKTVEGLEAARAAARALYDSYSLDGISEDEQKILDAIGDVFDLSGRAIDEIVRKAAEAEEKRKRAIDRDADALRQLEDIDDPVLDLGIAIDAAGKKFPALIEQFAKWDVSTQEGRDAMEAWLIEVAKNPEALQSLADSLGITVDELLQVFLGLESGIDSANAAVKSLADTIRDAFSDLNDSLEIRGITDGTERLVEYGKEFSKLLPNIGKLLGGFDLSTKEGRAAAEKALVEFALSTSSKEEKAAAMQLLREIRGLKDAVLASRAGPLGDPVADISKAAQEKVDKAIQSITVSQLAFNPQFARAITLDEIRNDLLRQILGTVGGRVNLSPPNVPASFGSGAYAPAAAAPASGGTSSIVIGPITINVQGFSSDPKAIGEEVSSQTLEKLSTVIDENMGRQATISKLLNGRLS